MIYKVELKIKAERYIPGHLTDVHVKAKTIAEAAAKAEKAGSKRYNVELVASSVSETDIEIVA